MKSFRMIVACMVVITWTSISLAERVPEPEYIDFILDEANYTGGEVCDSDDWYDGGGEMTDGTCTGACLYDLSGTRIHCTVPSKSELNTIVGWDRYTAGNGKIIMCNYQPVSGVWQWVRIGSCDRDSRVRLLVDGKSVADAIAFIDNDTDLAGNLCDFKASLSSFEAGYTWIVGNGGCDQVWGSQWDDDKLEAEYLAGEQSDDNLFLTADAIGTCVSYPTAHGQEGADHIYGTDITVYSDHIWSDIADNAVGAGDDYVEAYGGNDQIAGGYGNDEIWAGRGNDEVWGGFDDDDLYGETENDTLYGGNGGDPGDGTSDYCNGGSGTDTCDDDCETKVSCEL